MRIFTLLRRFSRARGQTLRLFRKSCVRKKNLSARFPMFKSQTPNIRTIAIFNEKNQKPAFKTPIVVLKPQMFRIIPEFCVQIPTCTQRPQIQCKKSKVTTRIGIHSEKRRIAGKNSQLKVRKAKYTQEFGIADKTRPFDR